MVSSSGRDVVTFEIEVAIKQRFWACHGFSRDNKKKALL
jgi:hypothetical protein